MKDLVPMPTFTFYVLSAKIAEPVRSMAAERTFPCKVASCPGSRVIVLTTQFGLA